MGSYLLVQSQREDYWAAGDVQNQCTKTIAGFSEITSLLKSNAPEILVFGAFSFYAEVQFTVEQDLRELQRRLIGIFAIAVEANGIRL
jgi:hypothetical protein